MLTRLILLDFTLKKPPVPYDQACAVMKTALDKGANFWNAGEFYGPPDANSLHLLRHYFTRYPEDRNKVIISIKGAFSITEMRPTCDPESIQKSIDNCLKVLDGTCFINIFEPARIDPTVPIETTVNAVADYVKAGKIGGVGLSEPGAETIRKAHALYPIAAVETELSLFTLDPLENGVSKACADCGIPLVAYSPLARGFLTGDLRKYEDMPKDDHRHHYPRYQPDVFDLNVKLVEALEEVAKERGCTLVQAAIAWVSAQSLKDGAPVVIPIPGATRAERVEENMTRVELKQSDMDELEEVLKRIPVAGARAAPGLQKFNAT